MKIEADIFSAWVKAFHKKLLEHQNERNEGTYMDQLSAKEIDRLAQRHADEARKQFVDDITEAERKKKAAE